MKMMKNWKRFWTLDRHHAEGFTLVELIVVIAILAILAGVAVPAYSGYITEANKTADRQLVRDVENALMMGYYQGIIDKSGMVTLSKGDPEYTEEFLVDADPSLKGIEAALRAAFGDPSTLKLKGDWKGDVAGVYEAFSNSSFGGREDALLKDVQVLTGEVAKYLNANGSEIMQYVGDAGAWEAFVQKHNVNTADENEVANSTAMYVAQLTVAGLDEVAFVEAWTTSLADVNAFVGENMQILEAMAAHYARAEAIAKFIDDNKTAKGWTLNIGDYESMTAWFSANGKVDSTKPLESLETITGMFMVAMGDDAPRIGDAYIEKKDGQESQGEKDAKAYLAMMGAINDNSDKLMEGKGEANLYDGGMASDLLHSYLAAGEALSNQGVEAGKVAVVITIENGRCTVVTLGMNEK